MMLVLKVVVSLCFLVIVNGQVTSPGICPRVPTKPGFDINRYLGRWYESEKFFFIPEIGLKCNSAFYSLNRNGTVNVFNSGIEIRSGMVRSVTGLARGTNPFEPGRLSVQFSPFMPPGQYLVLDTDYHRFSLVYSCRDMNGQKSETVFILTRRRFGLTPHIRRHLYSLLHYYGINPRNLMPTDQSFCADIPIQQVDHMPISNLVPGMQRPIEMVHPPVVENIEIIPFATPIAHGLVH